MSTQPNTRTPRDTEVRTLQERPKQWQQPELLPEPDKLPGYSYRYIRVSMLSNSDPQNVSSKFHEGWEPVLASEQPHLKLLANPEGRFADNIEIGGLLLCKTPIEFTQQRDQHYANITANQMDSVDNNLMRQIGPGTKIHKERSSKVSFGSGQ